MSETKVNLTDSQLTHALTSYAQGKTSTQVLDDLFFDFPDLEDSKENRAMLRDQLRSVNPHDKRFSRAKYGHLYDMVYTGVVEELRKSSRDAMHGAISSINEGMSELDVIGTSLQSMLGNASDFDITSNTEYLNTVRTLASLQKVRVEGVSALSSLVEQLVKLATAVSPSSDDE